MTTRHTVESTRANRQRSTEYLPSCANRHPLWRIVISCNESFDSSRIVSNRQHFLHCMVQKILKKDLQSFRALRTWEVHVFLCKSTSGMRDRHLLWRVVRFESNRVESCRIVSNRQNLLHCMVQKILTIDFQSFHALRTWEVYVFLFKSISGMTDRHLLWRVVRFESNRVESSTFAKMYIL